MVYMSSDTNIWLDFMIIDYLELPFRLPYIYLMYSDAIADELLSPPELNLRLIKLGLQSTEITIDEFFLAQTYMKCYPKLSKYDSIALSIAKTRHIILLTGDGALRKAAIEEKVEVIGTIGILDELYHNHYIEDNEYFHCLKRLIKNNGKKIRLPNKELEKRIKEIEKLLELKC